MIELKQVTKRFGTVEAVKELSFVAPSGQIVGLLGQNGAGKTTTLNMLTGYFPPTAGQVLVDGMDMLTQPRECKRRIGYLPEKPPLYDEMTV
ncbi:MAG: ATP-binding cassette domain-containing protein, partial [Clostridia bacterium]|nr:ATP-binding cassette domain-containing protein [Clostridia bacterium]